MALIRERMYQYLRIELIFATLFLALYDKWKWLKVNVMKGYVIISLSLLPFAAFSGECPASLQGVVVHEEAKLCQQFSPSEQSNSHSLSYFAPVPPEMMLAYYQQQHSELSLHSTFNDRTLLTMQNDAIRVVVSHDQNGSQVDILVL